MIDMEWKHKVTARKGPVIAEHIIPGKPAPDFLLDKSHFPAISVIDMELLAEGEYLALDDVLIVSVSILDGELVTPGKYLFSDIQFHPSTSLLDRKSSHSLFNCELKHLIVSGIFQLLKA